MHLQAEGRQTSVDSFWQPIHASSPVIFCPGALIRSTYTPSTPSGMAIAGSKDDYTYTPMTTAVALGELINLFSKASDAYLIEPASTTTLTDMGEHPVILIGAYNNEWTQRFQNDLRYRFTADPGRSIYDAMNPATTWERPPSLPVTQEDDFAIVARFHSKLTDNLVVLIAGIGTNGTESAAQFVTNPRYMDLLSQQLSKSSASKNIEVVLRVKVIDGKSGAPSIEAMYVW